MKDPIKIGDKIWHFDGALLYEGTVVSIEGGFVRYQRKNSDRKEYAMRDWSMAQNRVTIYSNAFRMPCEGDVLSEVIEDQIMHLGRIRGRIATEFRYWEDEHGTESETVRLDESPAIAALPVTDKIQPLVGCH